MSDEKLKPCPFCGGEAELVEGDYGMFMTGYAVYCKHCCTKVGVTGRLGEAYEWVPIYDTEAEAIAAWNARADVAEMAQRIQSLELECAMLAEELRKAGDRGKLTAEQVREDNSCAECAEGMGRYADSICDPLKQRIAELEEQRDVLLHCLENEWHISASWDGLRKFWCIELTEEGVKLRDAMHGTLTAEQVMAIAGRYQPDYCSDTHVCFDWQAIADELNKALGGGECEVDGSIQWQWTGPSTYYEYELSCGHVITSLDEEPPNYCEECGAKVVKR